MLRFVLDWPGLCACSKAMFCGGSKMWGPQSHTHTYTQTDHDLFDRPKKCDVYTAGRPTTKKQPPMGFAGGQLESGQRRRSAWSNAFWACEARDVIPTSDDNGTNIRTRTHTRPIVGIFLHSLGCVWMREVRRRDVCDI